MMKRRFFVVAAALTAVLGFAGIGGAVFAQAQTTATGKFSAEQYKKALWMVTRFYGAQRSGIGPNWLIMEHDTAAYRTSFTRDADGTYNLEGGWFDCGDHVTFGQTFFYSAYMLAKAYDAFPRGFHDLYNGKDYSDYVEARDWSIAGGKPNGIPDLLEELKYATDWIIKATPNGSTFYYEKGHGGKDHNTWVTAGKMSTQPVNDGGEPRDIAKNPNDGPMASFAAGTLAIMSKIYRKYDAAYADTCLNHAKLAYAYAKSHKSSAAGAASGSYYGAGNAPANTFNIAAAEMLIATKDNSYKNDIGLDKNNVPFHNWAFDYSNPHDIVPYAVAMAVPDDKNDLLDAMKNKFITRFTGTVNAEKVATTGNADWGALRYPANHAFIAALYQDTKGINDYDQFIYNQVDYILGENNAKQSFVVGFCESCTKQATKPHHRNVYLNDKNPNAQGMAALTIPERNKFFGYMVGGSFNSSSYQDNINSYQYTEGGLDYNAGLVGALAYIVSKLAPADTSRFGVVPIVPAQTPTTIEISLSSNPSDTASYIKDSINALSLYNGDGSGKQLYAHVFDQNDSIISNVVCSTMAWNYTISGMTAAQPVFSDTGCTFTVSITDDAVITSIKATYTFAGADRPSISKSIAVYSPPISVLPRTVSLAKHGYAMTVKPHAVTFTAAPGREITALGIYNIQGKRIFAASGKHTNITWNRANRPHGMYMIKLTLNNGAIIQRNLILK
ncbi:MAG: glycoside hydrolase family 9 protein [Chitinispirillales bacterium]|jgi:hypothetical protein|nr:glycoside hydrolase family 9 protein [Chitinispirillales bacterium]